MKLQLVGKGANSLRDDLSAARVRMTAEMPQGVQMSGLTVELVANATLWPSIAAVIIAWIRAKASRHVTITLDDDREIDIRGVDASEVIRLLTIASHVTALDTKPNEPPP